MGVVSFAESMEFDGAVVGVTSFPGRGTMEAKKVVAQSQKTLLSRSDPSFASSAGYIPSAMAK